MPSYQPFQKQNWESKQTKTGKNQQNNGAISKLKSMEKLNKCYKMFQCIKK